LICANAQRRCVRTFTIFNSLEETQTKFFFQVFDVESIRAVESGKKI
jgi:hypothetical protein